MYGNKAVRSNHKEEEEETNNTNKTACGGCSQSYIACFAFLPLANLAQYCVTPRPFRLGKTGSEAKERRSYQCMSKPLPEDPLTPEHSACQRPIQPSSVVHWDVIPGPQRVLLRSWMSSRLSPSPEEEFTCWLNWDEGWSSAEGHAGTRQVVRSLEIVEHKTEKARKAALKYLPWFSG